MLATSPLHLMPSRSIVHDISLTFFVTVALGAFFFSDSGITKRLPTLAVMYTAIGFGVLAKGRTAYN